MLEEHNPEFECHACKTVFTLGGIHEIKNNMRLWCPICGTPLRVKVLIND